MFFIGASLAFSDITAHQLQRCLRTLRRPHGPNEETPWLAVYGDSLGRAIFFDTVDALNRSTRARPTTVEDFVHPGHSANYSKDCTLFEERPPLHRRKCGGFAFDWHQGNRTLQVAPDGHNACPAAGGGARLSFRLKTFAGDPAIDEPWLQALQRVRRPPDAVLLSFGIWDMQYPPMSNPEQGVAAFEASLTRFLAAFDGAIGKFHPRPPVFWLSVTAVTNAKLPEWKRSRMSASLSQRYTALARPRLEALGVSVIDTYTSGLSHPELSLDGVHFATPVTRHHSQLFWSALCDGAKGQHGHQRRRPGHSERHRGTRRNELRRRRRAARRRLMEGSTV